MMARSKSPARELRDVFGDPRPPDISRKITACVACRKQKIKCHMVDSKPPCARCKKRGLPCNTNRSLQMLLESDVEWKHDTNQKIHKLEAVIHTILKNSPDSEALQQLQQVSEHASLSAAGNDPKQDQKIFGSGKEQIPSQNEWRIGIDLDLGSTPGNLPGRYQLQSKSKYPGSHEDIISRGIITLENAGKYYDEYQNRLDHFRYRILADYSTAAMDRIREESPLLLAAMCTVGALHLNSKDFDGCYEHFVSSIATLDFHHKSTLNDVRALCIGAFWLSDLSWPLVGKAVQLSTELQLHKSFYKALDGSQEHYLRTRLYLHVYACDHHFSVAYGRPPMTRESEAVRNVRKFLDCKYAVEDDARLVNHVLRWSICSNIYDTFGADVDRSLSDDEVLDVRRFRKTLDELTVEWTDRFNHSSHVGNYPNKGTQLQYNFAKLYLCSHVLRGAGPEQNRSRSSEVAMQVEDIANSAVTSATIIIRSVISDTETQSFLNGLPIYFDIMIAFAVVFLLKVSTKSFAWLNVNAREIQLMTHELLVVLKEVTASMHKRHVLVSITKGIDSLLQRHGALAGLNTAAEEALDAAPPSSLQEDLPLLSGDEELLVDNNFDDYPMSDFDLLWNQGDSLATWDFRLEGNL